MFLIVVISGLNSLQGKKQILEQIKTETVDAIDQPWKIELANLQNQINELKNQANFDKIYPIGSIYMSVKNENPSSLFGGTWEAWGSGKVPVGIDTTQTEFVTVEKTGGEKTHTLTIAEMPSHTHIQNPHSHYLGAPQSGSGIWTGWTYNSPAINASNTNAMLTGNVTAINQSTGGSQSHNNLQPYITCYMWKRIS